MNQKKKCSYFEGWYFKNQRGTDVISLIPARHIDEEGVPSSSIQVITPEKAYQVFYPYEEFAVSSRKLAVRVGKSIFTTRGILLNIQTEGLSVTGQLKYRAITPLRYHIMGPFCLVPRMQCRHSIYSLTHRIEGHITVNGIPKSFDFGQGYIEGDRGNGFPEDYFWTQCSWWQITHNCIMLAVAKIPLGPASFTGCIGVVYYQRTEYRFATYLGVKIKKVGPDELWVQQGEYSLWVKVLDLREHSLLAPVQGRMKRTVYESVAARIRYRFTKGDRILFDFVGNGCFERGL